MNAIRNLALITLGVMLVCLQACQGSASKLPAPTDTPPYVPLKESQRFQEAQVTFTVQVPPDTPKDQPIYLDILDEVTGLALNQQRYPMKALDDRHYVVTLSLQVGSVIKYRYSRQGLYTIIENTTNKRPVRYRLYRVDGPSQVQDIVGVWSDSVYMDTMGRITGQVLDAKTDLPVPGLLITAGGAQTLTASDGSFLLEGLPSGLHTLVAYAVDGSYRTFQQGALVAAESTTLANFKLEPASYVQIIFKVKVPSNTLPGIPVRIAGNLTQFGNTFADLTGGISTIASRMPILSPQPDGRYSTTLTLPSGAYLQYKYTLGDGFWNAEHDANHAFQIRHLIVPDVNTIIEEEVDSWGNSGLGPVLFDLTIPEYTPSSDFVSIQFTPFGWTEPIPMWKLSQNHWAYMLYSPLDVLQQLTYRYCRNDQCGSADDSQTAGEHNPGRTISLSPGPITIQDSIQTWQWLQSSSFSTTFSTSEIIVTPRPKFVAGIELQNAYHPSWMPRMVETFEEIHHSGANWIVLTPTWTYTGLSPLILEPVLGQDPTWEDLTSMIARAQAFGLKVAIFPLPNFQTDINNWWLSAPKDYTWWHRWFEQYQTFLLHHADLAEKNGADALILGGEWIKPALATGLLPDGTPSNVPMDISDKWPYLFATIRARFHGEISWALEYPDDIQNPPDFIHQADWVYILWNSPLAQYSDSTEYELYSQAAYRMDSDLLPLYFLCGKPIVLGISYPSADGGITGCLYDSLVTQTGKCLNLEYLSRPRPDIPTIAIDLEEQAIAYQAMFMAVHERDWIGGLVSRGYYPPAALQDKSSSVHGKPAAEVLAYWFKSLTSASAP